MHRYRGRLFGKFDNGQSPQFYTGGRDKHSMGRKIKSIAYGIAIILVIILIEHSGYQIGDEIRTAANKAK